MDHDGIWDGSDLPPGYVKHDEAPPAGGGGGGPVPEDAPLDGRDKGGRVSKWPAHGIRPALGGWNL